MASISIKLDGKTPLPGANPTNGSESPTRMVNNMMEG